MLEKFDDGGGSVLKVKGVFIMDFGQFLAHKLYEKECQEYGRKLTCVSDFEYVSECVRVEVCK